VGQGHDAPSGTVQTPATQRAGYRHGGPFVVLHDAPSATGDEHTPELSPGVSTHCPPPKHASKTPATVPQGCPLPLYTMAWQELVSPRQKTPRL
jgi:hypothetical protein